MDKKELRAKYKAMRMSLTSAEVAEKSMDIANNTIGMPIWAGQFYHVFLPILKNFEPDTDFLLHILAGKEKTIVVSKSHFDTFEMTHYILSEGTRIVTNEFGIPEPVDGITIDPKKIDAVFVPLLAFDEKGHRVGYGKGFYDRFLMCCRPDVLKVGLSFFEAERSIDGISENDIALDYCVTPNKIYDFNQ